MQPTIRVREKATGKTGTMPAANFDPSVFERLDTGSTVSVAQQQPSPTPVIDAHNTALTPSNGVANMAKSSPQGGNPILNTIEKVGNFIAPETTARYKKSFQSLDPNMSVANKQKIFQELIDPKSMLKSGLEAGSFAMPAGETVPAAMAMGGVSGAMKGASEGNGLPDIKNVLTGALGGIAGGAAGKAIGASLKGLGGMINNMVFDEGKKAAESVVKKGAESLGQEALNRGEVGTAGSLFKGAYAKLQETEDKLQGLLDNSPVMVDMNNVYKTAEGQINKYLESGNKDAAEALLRRVDNISQENGMQVSAAKANDIKRQLYLEADKSFGTEKATAIEGVKQLARGFKEELSKIPGVNDLNKELSYQGRVKDAMLTKLGKEASGKFFNALNVLTTAGGLAAAPFTGGTSLGVPIVSLLASSPLAQTFSAQTLKKLGDVFGSQAATKTGEIAGTAAANTLTNPLATPSVPQAPVTSTPTIPTQSQGLPPIDQAIDNTITIQNPQTGETKTINRSEMGQYGLGDTSQPTQPSNGGFTKDQIDMGIQKAIQAGDMDAAKQLMDFSKYQFPAEKKAKMSGTQVKELSDLQDSINLMGSLNSFIEQNKGNMGPVKGQLGAANPYDTGAQAFNSQMTAVAQIVGKALEGGVLRAEDVKKYRAILPNINDTPEVAKQKIQQVQQLIQGQFTTKQQMYGNYDTSADNSLPDISNLQFSQPQ